MKNNFRTVTTHLPPATGARRLLAYLLVGAALAGGSATNLSRASGGVHSDTLETIAGSLSIMRVTDGEQFVVQLGDRLVARFDDYFAVSISNSRSTPDAQFVLIELTTGGNACPSTYRALEIKSNGEATLSDEFGNCSDLPSTSLRDGALQVRFPRIGGAAPMLIRMKNGSTQGAQR